MLKRTYGHAKLSTLQLVHLSKDIYIRVSQLNLFFLESHVELILFFILAVFIDNSTLGIFFGMDGTSSTKDLLLLDVRDVNRISIADTYPLRNTPKASGINTTQPDSSGPSKSTGISIGVGISCVSCYIAETQKKKNFILTYLKTGRSSAYGCYFLLYLSKKKAKIKQSNNSGIKPDRSTWSSTDAWGWLG